MSIRVIVVDDSAFMRKVITNILESSPKINVVATARNGVDGLKKILEFKPDVVTLDVEMPIMDGMETLEQIMMNHPLPVVMLSSVSKKDTNKIVQAMSKGAVDFIEKPSGAISLNITDIKEEIIKKVVIAAEAKVIAETVDQVKLNEKSAVSPVAKTRFNDKFQDVIIGIGTSTGGPKALLTVLKDFPSDFKTPILIVQHMPVGFTKSLAERLNHNCKIAVKEAEHGDIVKPGTAYIAPGDYHMIVRKSTKGLEIILTNEDKRNGHRPSVDVLFESISSIKSYNKVAVVLTGMGSDGSAGIKALKKANKDAIVITENAESSVVYGMPKAAVMTKCVDFTVHLNEVCSTIQNTIGKSRRI